VLPNLEYGKDGGRNSAAQPYRGGPSQLIRVFRRVLLGSQREQVAPLLLISGADGNLEEVKSLIGQSGLEPDTSDQLETIRSREKTVPPS
jgi:hypothetical protein